MDAGVPIKKPVAGIAMGLITNDDASEFRVLSDLQGLEDFAGDMDFKIAGTKDGITAIQMDTKIAGLTWPIIEQTLTQAYTGRLFIMEKMLAVIPAPREEMSEYAPRIITIRISPDRIGELIGPGGKNINRIIDLAGGKEITNIDIDDTGLVMISSTDSVLAQQAKDEIEDIFREAEIGAIYEGIVEHIITDKMDPRKEIGAIVEIWPGKTGMVHISMVANERIERISDRIKVGDVVKVKVMAVDTEKGRVSLSIKDVPVEK
jgi:polyribonucleotide nucleotidyltransferase